MEIFKGSYFVELSVMTLWDGRCLFEDPNDESDLKLELQKALFYPASLFTKSKNEDPFAGSKCLIDALENSPNLSILKLHLALEYHHLSYSDPAAKALKEYIEAQLKCRCPAHPLLLLALTRIQPQTYRSCFVKFCEISPLANDWLLESERNSGSGSNALSSLLSPSKLPSLRDQWEQLKNATGRKSAAMDELMTLTGIRKVKEYALSMFKRTLALRKMSAEDRKKNQAITLNFAFVGNPGTGKTTVARLFATILFDSGAREKNTFVEVAAQQAKSIGLDKFREEIAKAKDGVIFIDEAYELEPKSDKMGKAIVSEILTSSENQRDHLSIILAGYEDDIQEKLYSSNEGLKSRFETVYFEDFDAAELKAVWEELLEKKNWTCEEKATKVVVNRLVRMSKSMKKGFGNARDVRKTFERHQQTVMAREDFDGTLIMRIEDIVGVHPLENQKLKLVLQEIEEKIGWTSIKKSVADIIQVVRRNYERECEGLGPLDFSLNKLLIGMRLIFLIFYIFFCSFFFAIKCDTN
jgi:SpoVK/Ycf46/Vps4 family AAA+-type ATPase